MNVARAWIALFLLFAALSSHAAEADSPRYIFSWPLDGNTLKPRGGSTRGAPVTLDREPSTAWKALQAPGLTAQERDRRAILAMAGSYRVSFDFLEVASYSAPTKPLGPYQSWGTEKVYADAQAAQAAAGGAAGGPDAAPQGAQSAPADDNVVDAEFKEVKDSK